MSRVVQVLFNAQRVRLNYPRSGAALVRGLKNLLLDARGAEVETTRAATFDAMRGAERMLRGPHEMRSPRGLKWSAVGGSSIAPTLEIVPSNLASFGRRRG